MNKLAFIDRLLVGLLN